MRTIAVIFTVLLTGASLVTAQGQPQPPGGPKGPHEGGRRMAGREGGRDVGRDGGMRKGPMPREEVERRMRELPPERRADIERRVEELKNLPPHERRERLEQYRRRLWGALADEQQKRFADMRGPWTVNHARVRLAQRIVARVLMKNPKLRQDVAAMPREERIAHLRELVSREIRNVLWQSYLEPEDRALFGPGKTLSAAELEALAAKVEKARRAAVEEAIEGLPDAADQARLRELLKDEAVMARLLSDLGIKDAEQGLRFRDKPELRKAMHRRYLREFMDFEDGKPHRFFPEGKPGFERGRGEGRPGEGRGPGEGRPEGRGPGEGRPEGRPEGRGPGEGRPEGRRPEGRPGEGSPEGRPEGRGPADGRRPAEGKRAG